jgi:hypothetical protein
MKKLMTILAVFAMCGVAMAQGVTASSSAAEQIKLTKGQQDYINFTENGTSGSSGLNYYVLKSAKPQTQYRINTLWGPYTYWDDDNVHRVGQLYFQTADQSFIDNYNQANGKDMKKVVVQFAGTQIEWGNNDPGNDWIQDYGIYLCNSNGSKIGNYLSVTTGTNGDENKFELDPNTKFGVYYKDIYGNIVTTTSNWIGNYDTGNHKTIEGANEIIEYDAEHPDGKESYTYKKFMCLFETDNPARNGEFIHWEFMLQTMLDDPYYNVDPHDFPGNGETFTNEDGVTGQPLPGTLATLLIGGLCAAGLRKKNKK